MLGSTLVANIANQDCGGQVASSDTKPANVAIRNILPIPAPARLRRQLSDRGRPAGRGTDFSLAGISKPGSYRLYVTVSKDGQRLLTVPYYFIVQ